MQPLGGIMLFHFHFMVRGAHYHIMANTSANTDPILFGLSVKLQTVIHMPMIMHKKSIE